jgi:glycosyltransferase involved in cell wall biosynthesis
MKRILFVHNQLTRFVQIDRDLLAERFAVTEWHETGLVCLRPLMVRRAIRDHDLVFAWFASWHSFLPVVWARLTGKPSVVVVGGYDTANVPEAGYGSQRGGLRRLLARVVIHSASQLVANSQSAKREAVGNAAADSRRVVVIYHGVEPVPEGPQGGREHVVLTVGNVWRENLLRKGLLPFVQAAAFLPDVRFIHIGRWCDDGIDELRRLATPNVEFLGHLPDAELFHSYGRASVYVQASLHEGFGLSVAEAMSAGSVPVVTRAGALPEVVGAAGVYTDSNEPAHLAAAIRQALDVADGLRQAARTRVLAEFSLQRRRAALHDLVDRVLERSS